MSNDVNISTLHIEVTGSGGGATPRARSGQTLQFLPLTVSGSNEGSMEIAAVLPAVIAPGSDAILIGAANSVVVSAVLPVPGGGWFGGMEVDIPLPAVTAHITGTILGSVKVAGTLPMVTASVDMLCGALLEVAATLPVPTSAIATGWPFTGLQLPAVQAALHIGTAEILSIAGRLPGVEAAINIGPPTTVLSLELILPAATGAAGVLTGGVVLPSVRGSLLITAGTLAERITWVMNIENNAVTEFDTFEFKQFARAFNVNWAIGMNGGLYLLGGDTNDGSPISWSFETGLSDLGTRGLKGMLGAYLDGIFERHLEFTVVADRGRYTYNHTVTYRTNQENHSTQRISLGRGVRTDNVAFGLASKKGAYFEMDAITPEYVVSNRNLG